MSQPAAVTDDVAWRIEVMRQQWSGTTGPIPFLVARPNAENAPECCLSCGEPNTGRARCPLCIEAARQVVAQINELMNSKDWKYGEGSLSNP